MNIIFYDISKTKFFINTKEFTSGQSYLAGREREIETIFSMGNGYVGTRNSLEEFYPKSTPGSFIAGFYEKDINDQLDTLVKIPDWTRIKIFIDEEQLDLRNLENLHHNRYIDFKKGEVVRVWKCRDETGRITSIKITKYISIGNKHEMGKNILLKPENYTANMRILTGIDCDTAGFDYLINQNISLKDYASVFMKSKFSEREFIMLQKSDFISQLTYPENIAPVFDRRIINNFSGSCEEFNWHAEIGKVYGVNSVAVVYKKSDAPNPRQSAEKHFIELGSNFFDKSFMEHRTKWISRWKESAVKISGNKSDQNFIDFSIYHLITAGEFSGNRYSIPARELSGESYKGHVFWDTEMYLLPFFTYTKPEIARNLLLYRYNTLGGARQNAVNEGYKGASYAWESTESGLEDAPAYVILPNGQVIYILSGQYENHISSDVAYAVWKYYEATHDKEFMVNYGAEILFETARFCESLLKKGEDGLYHIPQVIGPDEYHEKIDDNAYTNYLAAHNFDIAVKIYEIMQNGYEKELSGLKNKINLDLSEIERWKEYRKSIYTGYDENTMLFEQFKGFYNLNYVDLKQFEPRSVPMDIILGSKKIQQSQIVKQADVLMFMYLFGDRFSQEQVRANYEFYEPRTGHGSSLSPSIHSLIAARTGKTEDAYKYFSQNVRIDLDDQFGNAAGGIHIASVGGTWLAVVMGFAGMEPSEKGLSFYPNLPESWKKIIFSVKWRGQDMKICMSNEKVYICLCSENPEQKHISVKIGDKWKEFNTSKSYCAVKTNEIWNWKD